MASSRAWLSALRRYFCVVVAGNLAWEFAQLPLYTLWKTGSATGIVFATLHCTGGDVLIAGASLIASLLLFGAIDWPCSRFLPVAAATSIAGLAYAAYSEHLNTARGAWTYSDLMPVLPGLGTGLAPLAQWIAVPLLALAAARSVRGAGGLDLPTMAITTSRSTPDHRARSDRRAS